MPIEFGLWRIDEGHQRLSATKLDRESRLEDLLAEDPNMLGQEVLILGRQVRTASGNFIDLLGIDADGDLYIIIGPLRLLNCKPTYLYWNEPSHTSVDGTISTSSVHCYYKNFD